MTADELARALQNADPYGLNNVVAEFYDSDDLMSKARTIREKCSNCEFFRSPGTIGGRCMHPAGRRNTMSGNHCFFWSADADLQAYLAKHPECHTAAMPRKIYGY